VPTFSCARLHHRGARPAGAPQLTREPLGSGTGRMRSLIGLIPGLFLISGIALWSWALRQYRADGDPFALLLVFALPISLVVGVIAAIKRARQLRARPGADASTGQVP